MPELIYCTDAVLRREKLCSLVEAASVEYENVYLLVPEQQVLETEQTIFSRNFSENIEVTSFKRISNNIFRKFGGLCYNYIGPGAKQVVMWRAIMSVLPTLKVYSDISLEDMSAVKLILSAVDEMKSCSIPPAMLEDAALKVGSAALSEKLSDLALIYSVYGTLLSEKHDDAADDLSRACSVLDENDFFGGACVIFDSFDGFTQGEYEMISRILSQADHTVVALSYDLSERRRLFDCLRRTDRALRRLCARLGKSVTTTEYVGPSAAKDEMIAEFTAHFHDGSDYCCKGSTSWDRGIKAIVCPTPVEEARFVACDIARRVEGGARYRDFAVIMRSADRYKGIIDAFLEDCRIPFFISARKDLSSAAEIRMIFSALSVCAYNFRYEDVVSYMRSGLSGLSSDECDLLEEYATLWKISGRRWYDEYGWQMNPKGFTADFDEETLSQLAVLNSLRERLVSPLCALADSFGASATVRSVSAALFSFFSDIGLKEKLSQRAEYDKRLFGPEEAGLGGQIYDCVIDALDGLVLTAGEVKVSASEYIRLFMAVISESDVGRLPSRLDEVTVGSADLIRKSNIKHVYIIGLNEGEFPAPAQSVGFFDDDERQALSDCGITTVSFGEDRQYDEELYFFRAVSSVSDSVCLSCCERDMNSSKLCKSPFFSDAEKLLLPDRVLAYSDIPERDLLYGLPDIIEYAVKTGDDALLERVCNCSDSPLDAANENIPERVCSRMYGEKMVLTQSRIERYVMCSFAYHCAYGMKLRRPSDGRFESSDVGNYIHKILESFFSIAEDKLKEMNDDEAYALLDGITDEYIASMRAGNFGRRFEVLTRRLKRSSRLLVKNLLEEFRASDFKPRFFELPITLSGEGGVKAEEIPLPTGGCLSLVGKIDRVDTYEKDNDVYVRIVDYKTGAKTFSMRDVGRGLNLQLLVYLFSLCSGKSGDFGRLTGCKGELFPAGVIYMSSLSAVKESERRPADDEAAFEQAQSVISRSGVLLSDPDILYAMDREMSGKYISLKVDGDKGIKSASSSLTLESLEELGKLEKDVRDIITQIALKMRSGNASAAPLKDSVHDACKYCPYKPVCRVSRNAPPEEREPAPAAAENTGAGAAAYSENEGKGG